MGFLFCFFIHIELLLYIYIYIIMTFILIISTHMSFSSCISQKALQVAIRMRLAYIRKPEDSKRGNAGQSSLSQSKKVQQPKKPSIPSKDITITVEDRNSMHHHLSLLNSQLRKVTPSQEICQELMMRTFQ